METPHTYAAHLATYIASPCKIEKLVALEFDKVPPLHEIARMRLRVEREAKRGPTYWCKDSDVNDGEHYRPRSLVKPDPAIVVRPRAAARGYVPVTQRPSIHTPAAVREIIAKVAEAFDVTPDEIIGRRRAMLFVLARATAVQLVRDRMWESGEHRHTITQIGCFFGNRDHSTICYALDRFQDYLRHYQQVREAYDKLREADL
jgi:hypothetical protein